MTGTKTSVSAYTLDGEINSMRVDAEIGVRPVIWIDLSSEFFDI